MPTGLLKRYFADRGFGFIKPDDGSPDLFAPKRNLAGDEESIRDQARVVYESEIESRTGKPVASTWSIVEGAAAANPLAATLPGLAAYGALPGLAAYGAMPGLAAYGASPLAGFGADRFNPYGALAAAGIPGMQLATAGVALPPGWEQVTDPTSGKPYYCNRATGESSWVPPEAPAAAPVMEEMLAPAPMPVMPVEPAEMSQEAQLAPMETSSQETALVPASEGDGQAPALEEPPKYLQLEDLINTKWIATLIPINGTWLPLAPGSLEREFVLLEDGSVVWPTIGKGGGPGTVGKWFLKGDFIEFQRFTGWGNILGMFFGGFDTYTADADINVNEDLQFTIRGFMRSFNAYMPVQAMCDFTAVRQPGRFAMISNEEEDE
mmetsp:Transcript_76665/g.133891  ORF Transcript_76665/g.133891 Transcript_76665/m.133891 type:complete len:379 (-) Transcript_76665:173-1309(-)